MKISSLHWRHVVTALSTILPIITVVHCRAWFPSTPLTAFKSTAMMMAAASVREHATTTKSRVLDIPTTEEDHQEEEGTKTLLREGTFGSLYEIDLVPSEHAPTIATQVPVEYEGLLTLPKSVVLNDPSSLQPHHQQQHQQQQSLLCLHRYKIWWMRPVFVTAESLANLPPETMFLLYKTMAATIEDVDDENANKETTAFQLVLPLLFPLERQAASSAAPTAVASSSLRGKKSADEWIEQDRVMVNSHYPKAIVYMGSHPSDPYALIQEAVEMSNALLFGESSLETDHSQILANNEAPAPTPPHPPSLFGTTLGWCTWNALYIQLSGESIVQAVKEMTVDCKIPIRWMIIDDGWQDVTGDENDTDGMQWFQQLKGMKEHPAKFASMSLKECVSILRERYHMQDVWCWHTLTGYWMGVLPPTSKTETGLSSIAIPPSSLHVPTFSSGLLQNDISIPRESRPGQGIGLPDDPLSFWNQYHSYLRDCGVTGVKVDAQAIAASLMAPTTTTANASANDNQQQQPEASPLNKSTVLRLQDAVMESVRTNFGNPNDRLLSCMAHAPEILYFLSKQNCDYRYDKPFLRAADDFYPDNPYSHGPHLVACAFNSLLLSQVSRVDWDMFTTRLDSESWVRVHAISRCLSGGPLYVSDAPDRVVKSVIDWIACDDGTTLPCREAAKPIADCLLRDPSAADGLPLVIFNTNGDPTSANGVTSGVLGVFNVAGSGQWDYNTLQYTTSSSSPTTTIEASKAGQSIRISPSQIPYFAQDRFATAEFVAVLFFTHQAKVLASSSSSVEVELEPLQSEAITFVPVTKMNGCDVASLGFLGTMMNGAGAVLRQDIDDSSRLICHVRGCGRFWWAIRRPSTNQDISSSLRLQMDGKEQEFRVIDSVADGDDFMGWGNDLLKAGFVLVSTEIPPSDTAKVLVLEALA